MKLQKYSPERAYRTQAGVQPLQAMVVTLALKGRQTVLASLRWQATKGRALPPPSGLGLHCPVYRGCTPACSLFRPSALGWET